MQGKEKITREDRRYFIGLAIFSGLIAATLVTLGTLSIINLTATILCTCSATAFSSVCAIGARELKKELAEMEPKKLADPRADQ